MAWVRNQAVFPLLCPSASRQSSSECYKKPIEAYHLSKAKWTSWSFLDLSSTLGRDSLRPASFRRVLTLGETKTSNKERNGRVPLSCFSSTQWVFFRGTWKRQTERSKWSVRPTNAKPSNLTWSSRSSSTQPQRLYRLYRLETTKALEKA